MASNFDKRDLEKAEFIEKESLKMIEKTGLSVSKNNDNVKNGIDLMVDNELIDIQYSGNFNKYGDIRIDILSAFNWKKSVKDACKNKKYLNYAIKLNILNEIQQTKRLQIDGIDTKKKVSEVLSSYIEPNNQKWGKYVNKNENMLGVLYFIYDESVYIDNEKFKEMTPSQYVFIEKSSIINELQFSNEDFNQVWCSNNFKINDKKKNGLNDSFESAFVAMNLERLKRKYPDNIKTYKTKEDFNKNFKKDFLQILAIRDGLKGKNPTILERLSKTNEIKMSDVEDNKKNYSWNRKLR